MRQVLIDRIAGFDKELEVGQQRLQHIEAQRLEVTQTMLRIQGARVLAVDLLSSFPEPEEVAPVIVPDPIPEN